MTINFQSPLQFAEYLVRVATQEIVELNASLEYAGNAIAKKAQSYIGHRQYNFGEKDVGAEWEDLADSTKASKERAVDRGELALQLNADYNPLMRTGELYRSIKYSVNLNAGEVIVGSDCPYAGFQEFGTSTIPPRPFIGRAAYELAPQLAEMFGRVVLSGFANGNRISNSLGIAIGYHQDISI